MLKQTGIDKILISNLKHYKLYFNLFQSKLQFYKSISKLINAWAIIFQDDTQLYGKSNFLSTQKAILPFFVCVKETCGHFLTMNKVYSVTMQYFFFNEMHIFHKFLHSLEVP